MAKKSKHLRSAYEDIDVLKTYDLSAAIKILKDLSSKRKFDETIELALCLGIDPRQSDQMVRGTVALPNGTGKEVRVAVFARGDKAQEANDAGADLAGAGTSPPGAHEADRDGQATPCGSRRAA